MPWASARRGLEGDASPAARLRRMEVLRRAWFVGPPRGPGGRSRWVTAASREAVSRVGLAIAGATAASRGAGPRAPSRPAGQWRRPKGVSRRKWASREGIEPRLVQAGRGRPRPGRRDGGFRRTRGAGGCPLVQFGAETSAGGSASAGKPVSPATLVPSEKASRPDGRSGALAALRPTNNACIGSVVVRDVSGGANQALQLSSVHRVASDTARQIAQRVGASSTKANGETCRRSRERSSSASSTAHSASSGPASSSRHACR